MNEKKRPRGDTDKTTPNKKPKVISHSSKKVKEDKVIGPFSSAGKVISLTPTSSASSSSSSSQKPHIASSSARPLSTRNLTGKITVPVTAAAISHAKPSSSSSSSLRVEKNSVHAEEEEEFIEISDVGRVGPFTSAIKPRKNISDFQNDATSSGSEEEKILVEEDIELTSVSAEASAASINIQSENDSDNDTTSPFGDMLRRMKAGTMASVPATWSQQLQEVADFACKESSVMPTLPAGTLPLMGAVVFFIGIALMAYTGFCGGSGECVDAREFLSSFGPIDGENASEFFERAKARLAASFSQIDGESATELFERIKARVSFSFNQIDGESASELYDRMIASASELFERAPTADYVIDQLSRMWKRVCAGKITDLSQLLTDKDIRVAVLMYLGAVIAIAGGYLTFVTMDSKDSFKFSSISTTERIALVAESFEKNSAAFVQWRDKTTSRISAWRDKQNSDSAPTPSFSLSSFFKGSSRAIVWAVKTIQTKTRELGGKIGNTIDHQQGKKDEVKAISTPEINKELLTNPIDEGSLSNTPLSSLFTAQTHKFTIFLTAKKPQIYSFLQRLDVTAAILSMMFLLLLVFLYHKRIKHFLSISFLPALGLIICFGMGKLSFRAYRWFREQGKKRGRKVTLIASVVKRILQSDRTAYPVEFIYQEINDFVINGTFPMGNDNAAGAGRRDSTKFSPLPHSQRGGLVLGPEYEDKVEVDQKTLKLLWVAVEKEILTDSRVVQVPMMFQGAVRKCWKIQGRDSSIGGRVDISSPKPSDSTTGRSHNNPGTKGVTKRWSIGWDLFKWISRPIIRYFLSLLFAVLVIRFAWIRYFIWWCFVSVFRFIKYILFQS